MYYAIEAGLLLRIALGVLLVVALIVVLMIRLGVGGSRDKRHDREPPAA